MEGSICGLSWGYSQFWKIWGPIDKKIREATSVTFDEAFSNKRREELLKSLADNSDQESNVETDTNSDFDNSEPASQAQQPVSNLTSPLSSPPSPPLPSISPTLPQLPQSAQTQLDRQNRRTAKATAKLQESQLRKQQAADRGDRWNPRRSQKTKDPSAYFVRIQAFFPVRPLIFQQPGRTQWNVQILNYGNKLSNSNSNQFLIVGRLASQLFYRMVIMLLQQNLSGI